MGSACKHIEVDVFSKESAMKGKKYMELRKINTQDAFAQWEYTTALPSDENGLTNPYHGVTYDEYMEKVLPSLISYEHPVNMPEWFVPETYYYLWDEGHLVGEFRIRHVSYKIAEAVGDKAGYVRNKGLDEKILKELIISALRNGPLKKADIYEAVKHAFPDVLTEEKQYKKLSNLLQKMKKEGIVDVRGSAVHAEWFLIQ